LQIELRLQNISFSFSV